MKLGTWMRLKGISADVMGPAIGTTAASVRRYVAGTRQPEWRIVREIFRFTGGEVTANDFLTTDNSEDERPPRPNRQASACAA